MSTENLLEPRYRVVAGYPNNPFEVGSIQEVSESVAKQMDQYPHLFERLEWWEDRTPEEMPRYVKFVKANVPMFQKIYKVDNVEKRGHSLLIKTEAAANHLHPFYYLPATEQEYLNHLSQATG